MTTETHVDNHLSEIPHNFWRLSVLTEQSILNTAKSSYEANFGKLLDRSDKNLHLNNVENLWDILALELYKQLQKNKDLISSFIRFRKTFPKTR